MMFNKILIILLCSIYCCQSHHEKGFYVDKTIDFDTIYMDVPVVKKILLKNGINDTIFIDKIMHSCECVEILNNIKHVLPHSESFLTVSLTGKKKGYLRRGICIHLKNIQEPIDVFINAYVQ